MIEISRIGEFSDRFRFNFYCLLNKVCVHSNYKTSGTGCAGFISPQSGGTAIHNDNARKPPNARQQKEPSVSFLDTGKEISGWVAAPSGRSVRVEPGCVQCGAKLQTDEAGKADAAGKCANCADWVSDGDDDFDDLED